MMKNIFIKMLEEETDDEKYFHKDVGGGADLEDFTKLAYENIKDILAIGFDP